MDSLDLSRELEAVTQQIATGLGIPLKVMTGNPRRPACVFSNAGLLASV